MRSKSKGHIIIRPKTNPVAAYPQKKMGATNCVKERPFSTIAKQQASLKHPQKIQTPKTTAELQQTERS